MWTDASALGKGERLECTGAYPYTPVDVAEHLAAGGHDGLRLPSRAARVEEMMGRSQQIKRDISRGGGKRHGRAVNEET
jgi:hypothetical protein